jgi:vitamin B12 transporter
MYRGVAMRRRLRPRRLVSRFASVFRNWRAGTHAATGVSLIMQQRFIRTALAVALASAFNASAYAADEAAVIVTATRQPQRANELLSDVSVISREEIEQAGQATLEQLLARQPGIEYTANGGPGTLSSIFIRGAATKQTVVLIDGLRVGSASSGDVAFSRIPLNQIERIEILRGPASSLYGADAVGGVIQIFTRRGDGATHFNASGGYGTYNTTDLDAGVSGGNDTVGYSVQGGHFRTDGFSAIHNPANSSFNPDRDGYRNTNVGANLVARPAPGQEVGFNLLHSAGVSRYDSAPKAMDFTNEQSLDTYSAYSRNRLSQDWTSTLRLGRSTDDSTSRANGIATSVFHTDQDQLAWQNDVKLPLGRLLLAAEYLKQRLMSTTAFPVTERSIRSLLAGWNASIDRHRVQLNLRRDENSQFGGKTTGSAGYGYQIDADWRGHVSYGTAFRAPNFNELYFPNTFGAIYAGNASLRPEFARNREAGIDWEHGAHRFSAVYFNNKVGDLIVGYPLLNVSTATLSGTSLSYQGTLNENWSGGAVLDLQRPRDDATGKRLMRRADEQLKTHVDYTSGAWHFGGEWQLVGMRYDDTANTQKLGGYGLLNLLAEYRLERDWTIFARANNIFDKRYETAKDFATAGASLFAGFRYAP